MKKILLILILIAPTIYAVDPLPAELINFTSVQGESLFQRNLNNNSLKLLMHFTTQKNNSYCGIASAVIVLNASGIPSPVDSKHPPFHYFTQGNFFNSNTKAIITPKKVSQTGVTISQLTQLIRANGLKATPFYANQLNLQEFRNKLKQAITNKKFIIVNFLRPELKEEGVGHHSPIAAYDEQTDRFLLLDVARFKYPSYWVKAEDLWQAVHTKDGKAYRGFIIIDPGLVHHLESYILMID